MVASNCKYLKSHEWVQLNGTNATIGISDHAQDSLGDVTFVDLPKPGTKLTKGKECGVIESVKAASDLYSPVSGTVVAINAALSTTPETINKDPYGTGWLFKLEGVDPADLNDLLDAKGYEEFLKSEA